MLKTRFAILGGGLSGIYAAYLLEQQGIQDYVLIEARSAFGGRIESASYSNQRDTNQDEPGRYDRFDLGPTWFWPEFQSEFDTLINELKLDRVQQYEIGDMMFEREDGSTYRTQGSNLSPSSVKLSGSMSSLIDKLCERLNPKSLITDQQVLNLHCVEDYVEVTTLDRDGKVTQYHADQIFLAIPPRLAVTNIDFSPPLPTNLADEWLKSSTWMAPHAKYVALYETPFWRDKGLSGEVRSARGPLVEMHDASATNGSAALFGFIGIHAVHRRKLSDDELSLHCRAQLVRLFGSQAENPKAEFVKDWAKEPYTATESDITAVSAHGIAPPAKITSGLWQNRIIGIASEWSPQFPGYLAGAIEAAKLGIQTFNLKNTAHI